MSMQLYTDGSAHPQSRIGYGAYLAITPTDPDPEIQLKYFEDVGSSQLEIETVIWALSTLQPESVTIYTDSQTLIGLPGRRARLEESNYLTRQQKPIKHEALYRSLFKLCDEIHCRFVKVRGHGVSHQKTEIEHRFTRIDRAARLALRTHLLSGS